MTEYRLGSNPLFYAPGIIAWAINGYAFKRDRKVMLRIVTEGWNIPKDVAVKLLSKKIDYTVDGETVVFEA